MNHTAYETLAYGKVCEFLLSDWEFRAPLVAIQLGMRLLWTVNLFHFPQCSPLHFLEALPSLSVPVMLSSTCHCSHHRARKIPCAASGSPSRQPRFQHHGYSNKCPCPSWATIVPGRLQAMFDPFQILIVGVHLELKQTLFL